MEGIQFVVNDKGEQVAVQIDLRKHRELWEDFYDRLVARSAIDELRETIASVRDLLRNQKTRTKCHKYR